MSQKAKASWIIGGLLVVFLVLVIFLLPEPTEFQGGIIRFMMAITAGVFSYFFAGSVALSGKVFGQRVQATAGCALFVLVLLFFDPLSVRTAAADAGLGRSDPKITEVQKFLRRENLYTGEATGKADSKTRAAIRTFQSTNRLKADGYLNKPTLEKMRR